MTDRGVYVRSEKDHLPCGCWLGNRQQLNKSLGTSLILMRDATNWPFRGLAHQYVPSATHAYSVTCFQTFRQARCNFCNPSHPPKILNSFFQLLISTCRWLLITRKSRSVPSFAVLHCFNHVWCVDQPQKLSVWHICNIFVSKLIKVKQFSQWFVHNKVIIKLSHHVT